MHLLLSLIHLCISLSLFLVGLSPVQSCSSGGANFWEPQGFLPCWWLAAHSASLSFWVAGWYFLCLVLFAARLSVFRVSCLSCVIFADCACSGPTVTAYLVLPAYAEGGGGPPPSPLVPACSFLASWWTLPHARSTVLVLLAGNPTRFDGL